MPWLANTQMERETALVITGASNSNNKKNVKQK